MLLVAGDVVSEHPYRGDIVMAFVLQWVLNRWSDHRRDVHRRSKPCSTRSVLLLLAVCCQDSDYSARPLGQTIKLTGAADHATAAPYSQTMSIYLMGEMPV